MPSIKRILLVSISSFILIIPMSFVNVSKAKAFSLDNLFNMGSVLGDDDEDKDKDKHEDKDDDKDKDKHENKDDDEDKHEDKDKHDDDKRKIFDVFFDKKDSVSKKSIEKKLKELEKDHDVDEDENKDDKDEDENELDGVEVESTSDGKKLKIHSKGRFKFESKVKYDDKNGELEIEAEGEGKTGGTLKIKAEGRGFGLYKGEYKAHVEYPIVVDEETGKIYVDTPQGQVQLKEMPDVIAQKAMEDHDMDELDEVKIEKSESSDGEVEVKYKVKGTKSEKLFGVYELTLPVETSYDAATGDLLDSTQTFLTKMLDILSF